MTYLHNLRIVLAQNRGRQVGLLIYEVMAAGLIWLLTDTTRAYEVTGERELAGFFSGLAFCVSVVAVITFMRSLIRLIRKAANYKEVQMAQVVSADAGPYEWLWPDGMVICDSDKDKMREGS